MKSTRIKLLALAAVATLVTVGAQANPITGSMWFVSQADAGAATIATAAAQGTPDVTFNVNAVNFASGSLYTVGEFLASSGATGITGSAGSLAATLDGTLFDFKGQVSMINGETFNVQHDDGLTLVINGVTVVNAPGPTSSIPTPYTWGGLTGTYNFELVYGECCGAPAVLLTDLPLQNAPDGGSTMALLGGALTMMGVVARRFRK
jgi:hypothetical protein